MTETPPGEPDVRGRRLSCRAVHLVGTQRCIEGLHTPLPRPAPTGAHDPPPGPTEAVVLNDGLTAVGVARPIRSAPSRDAPIVLRRGQRIGAVRWAVTGNSAEMRTAPPRSAVAFSCSASEL